jgi:hypothetical protein
MSKRIKHINMKLAVYFVVFLLYACEDRYRYSCQNPDNFQMTQCQKPRCMFTQTCPEYLVAPVLEKQVESNQSKP